MPIALLYGLEGLLLSKTQLDSVKVMVNGFFMNSNYMLTI